MTLSLYALIHLLNECRVNSVDALRNLAISLSKRARLKSGEERDKLYQRTYEIYHRALALVDPKEAHEILFDFGNSLYRQALSMVAKDSTVHLTESAELSAEAIEPEHCNLESCLCTLNEASKRYEAAIAAKPDFTEALMNWGNVLLFICFLNKSTAFNQEIFEDCAARYFQAFKRILTDSQIDATTFNLDPLKTLSSHITNKDIQKECTTIITSVTNKIKLLDSLRLTQRMEAFAAFAAAKHSVPKAVNWSDAVLYSCDHHPISLKQFTILNRSLGKNAQNSFARVSSTHSLN